MKDNLVQCGCCGQRVSRSTERRHRLGLGPINIVGTEAYRRLILGGFESICLKSVKDSVLSKATDLHTRSLPHPPLLSSPHAQEPSQSQADPGAVNCDTGIDNINENFEQEDGDPALDANSAENQQNDLLLAPGAVYGRRLDMFGLWEDSDSESDGDGDSEKDEEIIFGAYDSSYLFDDDDPSTFGLGAWDAMGVEFEREAFDAVEQLSEDDKSTLRYFEYRYKYCVTEAAFAALPRVFPKASMPTFDRINSRICFLSGFKPILYDCCEDSCCCFTGRFTAYDACPFCKKSRYRVDGQPVKVFVYIPITARLVAMYENKDMAKAMRYRHEYQKSGSSFCDFFDGSLYSELQEKYVVINNEEMRYKHFYDPRDVALGLSTDGFAPYRRRKYTAWPLLLFNYNLPPEERNHKNNVISLGIIPGPKKPHDMDSFLYPFVEEMLKLSLGVRAWDAYTRDLFCLRAYLITAFGDIPAMSLVLQMKGHNAIVPCRFCNIRGLRVPDSQATTHYVPLDRSQHPDSQSDSAIKYYDPRSLPMRSHEEMICQGNELYSVNATRADALAKEYGIKGLSILSRLSSLSFPISFPYDFMHLIWENLMKNLLLLWTKEFKGLDPGTGTFELDAKVWAEIGALTAKTGDTIPSTYGARVPNIAGDRSTFTADNHSFWALYIGPVLMHKRFEEKKYYDHFIDLVRLLHLCLQFEISADEVEIIHEGFVSWVEKYEEFYYQHDPARIATCPLTIHALLHIADGIKACGPVWAYWAFPMERHCAVLQRAVAKSRRHPYETLNRFAVADAQLTQIKLRYNAHDEIDLDPARGPAVGEYSNENYKTCTLLPPHSTAPIPSNVRNRIVAALSTRFNVDKNLVKNMLPTVIHQYGKIRRADGGDTMLAEQIGKKSADRRDATFVRYEALIDKWARRRGHTPEFEMKTFYGQLQYIFVIDISPSPLLGITTQQTLILVEIQPCKIAAKHAVLDIHYYKDLSTPTVHDVTVVQCLVGRIRVGQMWAIIDRSGPLARAYYDPED